MQELIEHDVEVEWAGQDEPASWRHYTVLAIDPQMRAVKFRGRRSPDGSPFSGPDFWVPLEAVRLIEIA